MYQRKITLTKKEQKFVRENYKTMNDDRMARALGISEPKVAVNKRLMGLTKKHKKRMVDLDLNNGFWNDHIHQYCYPV